MLNLDYLAVDDFLKTELDAQVLKYALSSGLIHRLEQSRCPRDQIPVRDAAGRRLLADLLAANAVIEPETDDLVLTAAFRAALAFRELIEAKLAFADDVSRDVTNHFPLLLDDLPSFMERSSTFQLFRYDRCFEATPSNIEATRRWMRFTTALTRYEGRVLADHLDLHAMQHCLDVGGNSGELALQLAEVFPALRLSVFDLPVVCTIGRAHVKARGGADRITFIPGDLRRDLLPAPVDVLTLKSLLHDWPEPDARAIIEKAARALRPGGLLVIFERAPLRPTHGIPFGQLSNLLFFRFFREADRYRAMLHALGFVAIELRTIQLETTFNLITARRS